MSTIDQCPSTRGKILPATEPQTPTGMRHWRSVEEFSQTPEFREFVEREFPSGASEMLEASRRTFVKLMGASLALAGAATIPGCRRTDRRVMPYSRDVPEDIIPGRPLYYATAMTLPGGGAEGLLVETHTGRPTHIEGNPLHPINQGASSIWSVAEILNLYDPDRLKFPVYHNPSRGKLVATWDDFKAFAERHFKQFDEVRGQGLVFVVEKKSSPTRDAMRDRVLARWPEAKWVAWNPVETRGEIEGSRIATGSPRRLRYDLSKANVVLSLDSNFMAEGPDSIRNARAFAATRRVKTANDAMSRLYVAESSPTATGSLADHRFRLSPSQITALAVAVAQRMIAKAGPAGAGELQSLLAGRGAAEAIGAIPAKHVEEIVDDLLTHRAGKAVVIAGPSQPPAVHALVLAMNAALNSLGTIVTHDAMSSELASDSGAAITELSQSMGRGEVKTLVCIGTNPVYDAPAGLGFAEKFSHIETTVCWSVGNTETADASTWALNGTHFLESWGDTEAWDGTLAATQPMISPLYDPALSEIELLALLAGEQSPDGYTLVTQTWAERMSLDRDSKAFEKLWRRVLHDGMMPAPASRGQQPAVNFGAIAGAVRTLGSTSDPTPDALEVVFTTGNTWDGRHANNGWLQELPDVASKVVWQNPAYVSPATAKALGLEPKGGIDPYTKQQIPQARVGVLTIDQRRMELPVWILPGMPDNTVRVVLGYGRTVCGHVGTGVGSNTYAVRGAGTGSARGATLTSGSGWADMASTQNHWSMESRTSIVRAADKKYWDKHAGKGPKRNPDAIYGEKVAVDELSLAEKLGELSHTPPNRSIYNNPLNASPMEPAHGSVYSQNPQWGMSIDLASCTGCGVCTIACQSENNIPIVGEREVAKGREMHWIRVDRYFTGDDLNNPENVFMQPVACVHCENAPCETVCPVNATVHGPEGTNNMAYNRCIGTRYCANNCPYKVRRFNFFDYSQVRHQGGLDPKYVGKRTAQGSDKSLDFNQNLIPPRLRAKVDEIAKMQRNPNVTVRSRGVMEKCTYCIQRVNRARQEVKVRKIWTEPDQIGPIPDGFFKTACQAACPTESIVFGDILDPKAKVVEERNSQRSYMLLGYINTRPRTTYAMRIRNPNANIATYDHHDPFDHGGGHHASTTFIDQNRKSRETGYALSLRVLDGSAGVHA